MCSYIGSLDFFTLSYLLSSMSGCRGLHSPGVWESDLGSGDERPLEARRHQVEAGQPLQIVPGLQLHLSSGAR